MASRLRRRVSQYFAAQAASTTSASTAAATGRAIKRIAGSSAGQATVQGVGAVAAFTRRNNVGHWIDVPKFEQDNFGGIPRTGVAGTSYPTKDRLNGLGVKGVFMRYDWASLEPTQGVYDFSQITTEMAQAVAIGNARGQRFGLAIWIETRSFDGSMVAPAYLSQYTTTGPNNENIVCQIWRWHPTVKARWTALVQAIAAAFDNHPNFEGICTNETAVNPADDDPLSNYSPEALRDALIHESNAIAAACTFGRHFCYLNFISGNQMAYTGQVIAAGAANGAMVLCGPDILPGKDALVERSYPHYTTYRGQLPTQCSAQMDSHHWNSTAESITIQPFDTMQSIFDYARNTLKVNYVTWTWKRTGTGYRFEHDAIVINTTKTWQPSPGWVPPP
jgi:hypothetical protein